MNKEYLEAKPEDIANLLYEVYDVPSGICEQIKDMVQRLEVIENANPSEALNKLADISYLVLNEVDDLVNKKLWKSYFTTIKQSLLKSQEQEKVLEIIKQKNVDIRTLKECFKTDYGFQEYNKHQYEKDELTQEEFDLLKRWFK